MNRKLSLGFVFLFLAGGVSTLMAAGLQEGVNVKVGPVITQSFASKEVWPGETWKIYLNISDPDGGVKNIYAVVDQLGVGEYPLSITRIRGENHKELSGYIYLNTSTPYGSLEFVPLKLTVQVQDKEGHFSAPAVFPLYIQSRAKQELPPQGVFKEEALGPIMITLHSILGGAGSGGMGSIH
jgi:hypothetical protein